MEQFKGKNILNFVKELPNDDKCKAYLAKYKWHGNATCTTLAVTYTGTTLTSNTAFQCVLLGIKNEY
jgi:hypothetical protein